MLKTEPQPLVELLEEYFSLKDLNRAQRSRISQLVADIYRWENGGQEPPPAYYINKRGARERKGYGYTLDDLSLIERVLQQEGYLA